MRASIFGTMIVSGIMYFVVFHGSKNPAVFLNSHAVALVVGGTIGVAIMGYPIKRFFEIGEFIIFGFLFKRSSSLLRVTEELVNGLRYIITHPKTAKTFESSHPFVQEALMLLKQPDLNETHVEHILNARRDTFRVRYVEDAKMLSAIAKFPPALGLLGASAGMIEMMLNLNSANGATGIGEAMAVALTATFWGIALSNLIILPLADYATRAASEDLYVRALIAEAVIFAKRGFPLHAVMELLIGRVPVRDRVILRERVMVAMSDQVAEGAMPNSGKGNLIGSGRGIPPVQPTDETKKNAA